MSKNLSDIFPPTTIGGGGGGIEEAPKTGKLYARKDEAWQEFEAGDIEPGNADGEILAWSTADAEWMPSDDMIVKGGNVGIGDTAPSSPLSVRNGSSEGTVAEFYGSTDGKFRQLSLVSGTVNGFSGSEWNFNIASGGGEFAFSNLGGELVRIDSSGNVGIGMEPATRTAKEQLAEWKASFDARLKAEPKADKKAVTLEITDDSFEVLPTEEALAEWMETRAAGDKLQVAGNGSFSGTVSAGKLNSPWWLRSEDGCGLLLGDFSGEKAVAGTNGVGTLAKNTVSIGTSTEKFKDGHFSGTVSSADLLASKTDGGAVRLVNPGKYAWNMGFNGTSNTLCLHNDGGDNKFALDPNGNATFSGTVIANTVLSGTMNLRSARLYDTSTNGVGILFSPGASGAGGILPTDKDGQLVNLGPSIGSSSRKFNNAHFSGTVNANKFVGDGSGLTGISSGGLTQAQGDARYVMKSGNSTVSGTITATDFIATSDERAKDNITTAPRVIDQLHGREWDWKESGEKGSGVVAQELEEVLPHLVHTDDDGMKSVAYNGLIAYLIEEVKALRAEIKEMKS